MFQNLYNQFDWVLDPFEYRSIEDIDTYFKQAIVDRAEEELPRLLHRKGREMTVRRAEEFEAGG